MTSYNIEHESAAEHIHSYIRECDGDSLAAIYEYVFGAVESCDNDGDHLVVTYHNGLEPEPPCDKGLKCTNE